MKTFKDGLLYDTEKLIFVFDLENKPEKPSSSSSALFGPGNWITTGQTFTTTWVVDTTNSEVTDKKNYIYVNYIAKTPNKNKYVIVNEKRIKTDTGEEIKTKRDIIRFFKDVNDVRDYITEWYGIDQEYDKKIEELLTQIDADFQEA